MAGTIGELSVVSVSQRNKKARTVLEIFGEDSAQDFVQNWGQKVNTFWQFLGDRFLSSAGAGGELCSPYEVTRSQPSTG